MRTLGLYSPQGGYTNAAEILADTNGFPGIDLVRYGNSSQEIMNRKTVAGKSILEQLDQAMDFFRLYYTFEKIEGAHRLPKELGPEEAFREAIANALIHRTWDVPANIVVSMHPDRIEITSPGSLPPPRPPHTPTSSPPFPNSLSSVHGTQSSSLGSVFTITYR